MTASNVRIVFEVFATDPNNLEERAMAQAANHLRCTINDVKIKFLGNAQTNHPNADTWYVDVQAWRKDV